MLSCMLECHVKHFLSLTLLHHPLCHHVSFKAAAQSPTVCHTMQVSQPKGSDGKGPTAAVAGSGLSMQDDKDRARQLDEELIAEGLSHRQQSQNGASTSTANGQRHNDSRRESDYDRHGRPSRHGDSPDRERHWNRDRKRQHRSTSRDRDGRHKRRRSSSPELSRAKHREGPAGNRPPPAPLLDKPEKGGVYQGKVSGIMDFGCFVELQGFRGRVEGLVHLTNLSKTRSVKWPHQPCILYIVLASTVSGMCIILMC